MKKLAAGAFAVLVFASTGHHAAAADFGSVSYDAARDELVVEIIYRGTHADHEFSLAWDECRKRSGAGAPYGTAARVIDVHGSDVAREEYRVTQRFELSHLECRPALVTLRLGPVVNRTLYVPASPRGS